MKISHRLVPSVTAIGGIIFLSLTFLSKTVETKGVLQVEFYEYVNPKKQDYDGGCCEQAAILWKCDECDTYFDICLQQGSRALTSKKCFKSVTTKKHEHDNFRFNSAYGPSFGIHGEKNPLVYNFDTWQGELSIYMNVWDDDSGNFLGIGSKRDRIDLVLQGFQYLVAGPDFKNPRVYPKTLTGIRTSSTPTSTVIYIRLYCAADYYDGYCTTYCKPHDDDDKGHYTCKPRSGEKICRAGWTGKDCKTAICKKGCQKGHCKKPGECICSTGWTGGICDQCIRAVGCLNGDCVKGGDCVCLQDWSGSLCDQDMNPCRSNPCQNGAQCRNQNTKYHCDCVPGYQGVNCENEIDLCSPNPCFNNVTCINFRTDFQCQCPPGFKGRKCEQNIDECKLVNHCANNASCIDGINNYTCVCLPGFSGRYCDHDIDECLSNPCVNGICEDKVNNYSCSCLEGFTGRRCEENINDCLPNPCENNGNCTDGINDFACSCVQGWVGKNCSSDNDECAGNPCRNNGTCHDSLNNYNCSCLAGFTGKDCQININDCQPHPCQNNGLCVDAVNSFICHCKPGFSGKTCAENIDECKGNPCLNGGQCSDGINQYFCQCSSGFAGGDCEINIDECASNPCLNNATCVDGIANFTCNCSLGYEGYHCGQRIDYCKDVTCQYDGQCVNELGGYHCDCQKDYNGTHCENTPCTWRPCQHNGTCSLKKNSIRGFKCDCTKTRGYDGDLCENDIDYCDPANNDFDEGIGLTEYGLCGLHGTCVDGVFGYWCNCSEGWEGFMCQKDIDECYRYRPCQNNGECRERINEAGYHCICPTGYNGTNCETMINLCDQNPCCDGAICTPGLNSFTCNCTNGLKGPSCCSNSTWCSPDRFNIPTCSNHGNCTNYEDRFNCSCREGYTGNRCETDIDECLSRPCINGKCINLPGTYGCICKDNDMGGQNCEKKINDCEGVVCQNNGTCIDGTRNYTCECDSGYTGRHCETDINECIQENNCSPTHSVCQNTNGSYYCECREPFKGPPECKTVTDYCATLSPCQHGTCRNRFKFIPSLSPDPVPYDYFCDCYINWQGRNCDKEKCFCDHGDCINKNGTEICQCDSGYEGNDCSAPISARSDGGKADGRTRSLAIAIGMSFLALVLLIIIVALFVVIRRRRISRNRDAGTVKFTRGIDDYVEAFPKPLMFVNPIYVNDKGVQRKPFPINDDDGDPGCQNTDTSC